jgi:hypothetical protein
VITPATIKENARKIWIGLIWLTKGQVMKRFIFWDITQCSPLKAKGRSEEHVASIFSAEE